MPGLLFDRQRTAAADLVRLIENRRREETAFRAQYDQAEEQAKRKGDEAIKRQSKQRDQELADLDESFQREQQEITARIQVEREAEDKSYAEAARAMDYQHREAREKLQQEMQDILWAADSLLEAGQKRAQQKKLKLEHEVAQLHGRADELWEEFEPKLNRFGLTRADVEPRKVPDAENATGYDLEALLNRAAGVAQRADNFGLRRLLGGPMQLAIWIACLGLGALPALVLGPWQIWLTIGLGIGLFMAVAQRATLRELVRRRMKRQGWTILVLLAQAKRIGEELLSQAGERAEERMKGIRQQHAVNRQKGEARYKPQQEQLEASTRAERQALDQKHRAEQERIRKQGEAELSQSRHRYEEARPTLVAFHDKAIELAKQDYAAKVERLKNERHEKGQQIRARWNEGCERLLNEIKELQEAAAALNQANGVIPQGLPLGAMTLDLTALRGDLPATILAPLPEKPLEMPAFLPFPRRGALLLQAQGPGKAAAVSTLQALMLRFLTALPPGKVRFTILDPVGLGDNFAAFMHLADHDEALVSSRIWTEPAHIEAQLADITEHMETVIQKYLRSQFKSIEDYNVAAGEVAEPYRVLVIANFPINFSPQAARRLVSIVQSGAGCGVHVLISCDVKQAMPQGFSLEELAAQCLNLRWQGSRFIWEDPDLDRFPLALEAPPDNNHIIDVVRKVGEQSKHASKVEVPFAFLAPDKNEIWKSDSRRVIHVPLGRAGAVRRLAMNLGKGTAQHVLVAGKTGSGKSTLWHTLIVNLALRYAPDEIELYLIDFKKGVEFKMYAEAGLPHARVIAIESEREFGLSVLQKLDAQLRERGDLFRAAGVNDLASYREARPDQRCPRLLLIVDEFQEFFVEDDKLSQEAALLMDRLVRQGRAFGVHLLLGSQTLGGVYSLARSTIDQMAVRIALQCSEADAQLILSKDNSAARLLSRPGEAIYNEAGGAIEGNEIFQVVWLGEEERERLVRSLHDRAGAVRKPPIVFESSIPAALEHNPLLKARLSEPGSQRDVPRGWLGEAIAIKDPTAAVFRAQTGSHLLIVGQHEEASLALLAASLVSLAVQHPVGSARFWMVDGLGPDEPFGDYVPGLLEGWPHPVERVGRSNLVATLAGLAEEVTKRVKGGGERWRGYFIVHGLHRFREFRRDDEMSFGRRGADKAVSPAEHLQTLLRDGPGVGVHLLMWCDQLTNLTRVLDRGGLRECGLRVLFQMSAGDSSQLLDSPLASRLGRHRALFFHDEMAQPEKFRPYDLPSLVWLREVKTTLASNCSPVGAP